MPLSIEETKYYGVANVVAEVCWLCQLFAELRRPLQTAIAVYSDNKSAVYLSIDLAQHQGTKHVEIDFHFVCELFFLGEVCVVHVATTPPIHVHLHTKGFLT